MDDDVAECPVKAHHLNSKYPRNQVPISYFRKTPDDPNSKMLKTCIDCRQYSSNANKRLRERRNELVNESKTSSLEFLYCPSKEHETKSGSKYPRDKVPIKLFRKEPDNPKSTLLKNCSDCRKVLHSYRVTRNKNKKELAERNGNFYCTNCHNELPIEEKASNLNGTPSILCKPCKGVSNTRIKKLRKDYLNIKLEFIIKNQCCCEKCQCIFIMTPEQNILLSIITYIKNDIRYAYYNDNWYPARDMIDTWLQFLELDILHLDHLSESEQRERGLLGPNDMYIPKKNIVSRLSSENAMRLESLKCQLLCLKCHVEETIRREIGTSFDSKSHLAREKIKYIHNIKLNGCSMCGYTNPELPRFFHLDHLNPDNKILNISRMTKDSSYTFEQVVEESKKCRILCGHCHIIHTRNQRKEGII